MFMKFIFKILKDGRLECDYQWGSVDATDVIDACDDVDNDCDGLEDDADTIAAENLTTYYQDSDEDGEGDAGATKLACDLPAGYSVNSDDCDDGNAAINSITQWYTDSDLDGFASVNAAFFANFSSTALTSASAKDTEAACIVVVSAAYFFFDSKSCLA